MDNKFKEFLVYVFLGSIVNNRTKKDIFFFILQLTDLLLKIKICSFVYIWYFYEEHL